MAESDSAKNGYSLTIDGKYYNTLDIDGFFQMMKDPSYCYKFYWMEAIVRLISEGVRETTFDTVIDEMICNAWYSVREFHIHLSGMLSDGQVRDGLERAIRSSSPLSGARRPRYMAVTGPLCGSSATGSSAMLRLLWITHSFMSSSA